MLFSTWTFFVFFAVVLAVLPRLAPRWQNRFLLAASFVFYGWWDWRFLALLIVTILVDFVVGVKLDTVDAPRTRKTWLCVSLASNLGILGFFKYWNFFVESASAALQALGLGAVSSRLDIVLPVGISFYTFQSLSYIIDVYRRQVPAVRRLEDYALFVSYFPQLVAGPIERTAHLLPQLLSPRRPSPDRWVAGGWLITRGLFKKVVIADNLAVWADSVFAMPSWDNGLVCLVGLYAFAFQIYGDFSGYSDMARGVSRLMGIDLMVNFRVPYLSETPAEFWRRWHISLSSWLRDYVFLPISFAVSRRIDEPRVWGVRADYWIYTIGIVATMLLGGLWHGAAWTFVAWGLFHGLLLAAFRAVPRRWLQKPRWAPLRVVVMFHLACAGWLLFRAADLAQASAFAHAMTTTAYRFTGAETMLVEVGGFVLALCILDLWLGQDDDPRQRAGFRWFGWVVVPLMWVCLLAFEPPAGKSFIYFQF
jgi:D-alanyl-lipoteichoic acid acyltransferase DltB (MBOAT superfamily)